MKLNCIIDNKKYRNKPHKSEYGALSNRIIKTMPQVLSIEELTERIEQGNAYIGGHLKDKHGRREKANIENINFFSLDIDNKYDTTVLGSKITEYTNHTLDEVVKAVDELLNIKPMISYTTFSGANSCNNSPKFRLIYGLEKNINYKELELLQIYIAKNCGTMFDEQCKNADRIFQGTNKSVESYSDYKLLDIAKIDEIKAIEDKRIQVLKEERAKKREEQKSKGYDPNYSDNAIEEIVGQDMTSYLHRQGYDLKSTSNGLRMKCPLHNGRNPSSFAVYSDNGISKFKCHSCGASGDMIQLHQDLYNLSFKEALDELKKMYNIQSRPFILNLKALNSSTTDKEVYEVDKYISDNKKAAEGIIKAIEESRRISITAPMGTGKTHFTIKDIYNYAKAIGKTLIIVIPGVAQLSNLNNNKDIPIVCNQMPVYMGNDIVATTPESLLKVTNEVGKDNYILIPDESHERYTSLYRSGYRDKNIERAERTAYKSIHLTATADKLVYDNFDKTIEIKSKTLIKNKMSMILTKESIDDCSYSIIEKYLDCKRQVIFFNNNIDTNTIISELLKETRQITTENYEPGQIDLLKEEAKTKTTTTEVIVATETISSGKISENISDGNIVADLTCTTSTIMAGIDLYAKDNAVLIVNARGLGKDEIIQLQGRFRDGIEVILILEDRENKLELFDVDLKISRMLKASQQLADATNANPTIEELSDAGKGIKDIACLAKDDNGKWIVDVNLLVAKFYDEYNEALLDNPKELKKQLMEQKAFEVDGKIRIFEYNGNLNTVLSETKDATKKEKKEILKKVSKELCELEDNELEEVLNKEYHKLKESTLILCKQYELLGEKHLKKINKTAEHLYKNDAGVKDKVSAFRHFYDNTWTSIEKEIKGKYAREINRLIKKHGLEYYLSMKNVQHKRAVDVVQAKIRSELLDLEQKQGRLSSKRFSELVRSLIDGNYIYDRNVKVIKDKAIEKKDKERSLQVVESEIREIVNDIYNFKDDGNNNRISSIKE